MGTLLVHNPTFADVATGNFTLHAGTQQAKAKVGDPRWVVAYDAAQALPLDIVVNVAAEEDLMTVVDSVKATVDKVGGITINLAAKATYAVDTTLFVSGNLVINGDSSVIDLTGSTKPLISLASDTVTADAWKTIETIKLNGVVVKGLAKSLFYSAEKNYNILSLAVVNSVVEVAGDVTVFDFTKGSVANLLVDKSTIFSATATTKSLYSSQNGQKGSDCGATNDAPQVFAFQNSTLYNLAYTKNFFTHRSSGQTWLKFVVKDNVIVNCGKSNFMTSLNQGQDSKNPQYDVTTNSVGTLLEGVYTDLSASQMVQSTVMGTLVTSAPGFVDVAVGNFTLYAGSYQAKEKIGDPRWLVEYDEALGIETIGNDNRFEDGAWYTLQGIRVENPTKGLFIHNGKKVMLK